MAIITTGAVVGLGIRGVAGLVQARIASTATQEQLQQLAVRYWSCVLFEFHWNLSSLRDAIAMSLEDEFHPMLQFHMADALLPELARLSPTPMWVANLAQCFGLMREIDRLVRLHDAQSLANPNGEGSAVYAPTDFAGTARANALRWETQLVKEYREMRAALSFDGSEAYGADEWALQEAKTLPPQLADR